MVKNILSAAIASASLLMAVCSHADSSPYYVGVEFGSADHDANIEIVSGDGSITDSDSGNKIFFGYHFTSNVALEIQYADLGESSSTFSDGSTVSFTGTNINFFPGEGGGTTSEVTTFGISGVYRFNTDGSVKPFVKLGLHSWDVDNSTSSTGLTAGDTSGTDVFYGVGLDVSIAKQWALSVSYDVYDIDDELEAIDEVSTFGAGVNYKF